MVKNSPALRNILGGLVFAGCLGFASTQVFAFSCSEGTICQVGPLNGQELSCACAGPGECDTIIDGYAVACECTGFPSTLCTCVDGCYDLEG